MMWIVVSLLFLINFYQQSYALVIGSDSAVNRFNTQVSLGNGDEVAAFAALEGGFALTSATVEALMRTVFQVTGDIELNGGTLVLGRDLLLKELADIKSLGTIYGNNYVLDLAATTSCIPSGEFSGTSCDIQFITDSTQSGAVFSVDWSYDDAFLATTLAAAGGPYDTLLTYRFNGSLLTLEDSDLPNGSFVNLNAARWHPSELLLAVGKNAGGDELFVYSVNATTGALTQVDSDNAGTTNAVAWHPTGDYLATGGTANGAEIRLYPVDGVGNLDVPNRLDVNVAPNLDVQKEALDWDVTGSYLAAGFNSFFIFPLVNFRIYEFNDLPTLSLVENATLVITGDDVETVSWHPVSATTLAIGTDGTTDNVRILTHDGGAGTLTQENTLSLSEPVRTLHWSPDGSCLAVGTDIGGATELNVYSFDASTFALTLASSIELSDDVQSVRWNNAGAALAIGDDDAILSIYGIPQPEDQCVTFSDITVALQCNVELKDCCIIFSGDTAIRGRGKTLTLQPTCTVVVDTESTLFMKDITIKGVQDSNIQFLDNSGTISLQDVTWILDDDFTFTNGHFDVLKDFLVTGSNKKLTYKSEIQSTIQECGKMILDDSITFSYDPVSDARDLLLLTSNTSELVLQGATLHSTSTGLRLTTGILNIQQESFIVSEGSVESEAVSFGDGMNANNNLTIIVEPAARLELLQGCMLFADG